MFAISEGLSIILSAYKAIEGYGRRTFESSDRGAMADDDSCRRDTRLLVTEGSTCMRCRRIRDTLPRLICLSCKIMRNIEILKPFGPDKATSRGNSLLIGSGVETSPNGEPYYVDVTEFILEAVRCNCPAVDYKVWLAYSVLYSSDYLNYSLPPLLSTILYTGAQGTMVISHALPNVSISHDASCLNAPTS
jgi:hypothetical protein